MAFGGVLDSLSMICQRNISFGGPVEVLSGAQQPVDRLLNDNMLRNEWLAEVQWRVVLQQVAGMWCCWYLGGWLRGMFCHWSSGKSILPTDCRIQKPVRMRWLLKYSMLHGEPLGKNKCQCHPDMQKKTRQPHIDLCGYLQDPHTPDIGVEPLRFFWECGGGILREERIPESWCRHILVLNRRPESTAPYDRACAYFLGQR